MKTDAQVRRKLQQVLYRHLKKRLKTALKQAPDTCVHNSSLEPAHRREELNSVQACFYTTDGVPRGVICDVRYDNGARARSCGLWEPVATKEAIKAEFKNVLDTANRGEIAAAFPDAAALMWVLDEEAPELEDSSEEEDEVPSGFRWPWSRKKDE